MTEEESAVKTAIDALFASSEIGPAQAYIHDENHIAAYVVFYNGKLKLEGAPSVARWDASFVSLEEMIRMTALAVSDAFPHHATQKLIWRADPAVVTGLGASGGRSRGLEMDGDHVRIRITAWPPNDGDPSAWGHL